MRNKRTQGIEGRTGSGFGPARARARREADLFFADLMGDPAAAPWPRPTGTGSGPGGPAFGRRGESDAATPFDGAASDLWEVVAFPRGETPRSALRHGDLVITPAAHGTKRLARLRVLGEDLPPEALYSADGLVMNETLVLRPRPLASAGPRPDAFRRARAWGEAFAEQDPASRPIATVAIGAARFPVSVTAADDTRRPSMEEALRFALGRPGHSAALLGPLFAPGEVRVCGFTPTPAPVAPLATVIDCDAPANDLGGLVVSSGTEVTAYFPALRSGAPGVTAAQLRRWIAIPNLRDFYALPTDVQQAHRGRWITALLRVAGLGFTRAALEALSTPALRVLLAQNGAGAFAVSSVSRGTPPTDRGGVVNGVTLPLPTFPVVEPDCYLPVISEREGRLESINAWDAEAGISLGPIQINVNPAEGSNEQTLFRFLWRLFIDDRVLFDQAFGALRWRMRFDPAGPTPSNDDAFVLTTAVAGAADAELRSVRADVTRNFRYFQTGVPGRTGFVPAFRRDLAGRFRDVAGWPHVQQMILDISSSWLRPGLATIRAASIPALDPMNPDRDTFTLTAVLMSAYVRFSGCLRPLLRALARWTTVADKLAHLDDALATLSGSCPTLADRLRAQVREARAVHAGLDGIRRARGGGAPAEDVESAEAWPSRAREADEVYGEAWDADGGGASLEGERAGELDGEKESHTGEAWHEGWEAADGDASFVGRPESDEALGGAGHRWGAAAGGAGCHVDAIESEDALDASETAPSDDEVVAALDRLAGTSYRDFAGYRATLVDGTVFGRAVQGVHPDFLRKLQAAETAAAAAIGGSGTPSWGIASVGGFRRGSGRHNWGLAVDLNYASSPFIMHEHGEAALDAQLAPVYHRIARFVLGRTQSVIPRDITQGARGAARTARLLQALSEESAAMVTYFAFLRAPDTLDGRLASQPLDADAARAYFGDDTAPTAASVLRRIMTDYVILTGRAGPAISGQTYPTFAAIPHADRPFAGDPAARDPQRGFLSIRREVVLALSAQGLRWGAIDFGGESGDVMHFDDGAGTLDARIQRAKREAATRT